MTFSISPKTQSDCEAWEESEPDDWKILPAAKTLSTQFSEGDSGFVLTLAAGDVYMFPSPVFNSINPS